MSKITDFEIVNGVLKEYNGTDPNVVIPNGVTKIGDNAFDGCSSLENITIPDSVTEIGEYAFYNCKSLKSIIIPNSVTSIGHRAFFFCSSLTSIIIPNSVTSIGHRAFYYCSSLTSVTIPNSVTEIGEGAFSGYSSLASITVDPSNSSYKSIDGNLYSKDGKTLVQYAIGKEGETFEIPTGVTTIGNDAFSECKSLKSIIIPNSVTSIGGGAFFDCSSLTSVTIPNSVTEIGENAFSNCESLKSIIIPDGVTTIGKYAFYNCKSLTINCEAEKKPDGWNETWNSSNRPVNWGYKPIEQEKKVEEEKVYKEIEPVKPLPIENFNIRNGVLTKYLGAEEIITIPEGVKRISSFTFTGNYDAQGAVKRIILPKSLERIDDGAFATLEAMEQIVIPRGVKAIGRVAFRGCKLLTIYCEANEPPSGWDTRKYSLWSANCPVVWGHKPK